MGISQHFTRNIHSPVVLVDKIFRLIVGHEAFEHVYFRDYRADGNAVVSIQSRLLYDTEMEAHRTCGIRGRDQADIRGIPQGLTQDFARVVVLVICYRKKKKYVTVISKDDLKEKL